MTRPFSLGLAIAASLLLHACVFAPGQHLDTSRLADETSPESARLEMVPITRRRRA